MHCVYSLWRNMSSWSCAFRKLGYGGGIVQPFRPFSTEKYFEKYEFSCPYMLSASDCESLSVDELLKMGGRSSEELLQTRMEYQPAMGSGEARELISRLYQTVKADEVVVLGAPVEGIFLTLSVLSPRTVVALSPAYDALTNAPQAIGSQVRKWELVEEGDHWRLDFEALKKQITSDTDLLVVNFPHNPTGFQPSQRDLDTLVQIASDQDCWIFADEMYKGLEYRPEESRPSLSDLYPKTISLRGLSKTTGLPGLRYGWLIVKDSEVRQRVVNAKFYTSLCSPSVSDYLARVALEVFDQLASRSRNTILQNLKAAEEFFSNHSNSFRWIPPQAGSVSVAHLLEGDAEAYCAQLAEKTGVVLLPLQFMGLGKGAFRVGLGRTDFQKNLEVFAKVLKPH